MIYPRVAIKGFPGSSVANNLHAMQEMREMQVRSLGQEDPLEKKIATHFSILAWEIPWTGKPGRLPSMGSQELDVTERLIHHHQSNREGMVP